MDRYLNSYSVGLQNVGSYQSSGWPWITGSAIADGAEHTIQFPQVTKSITIIASGAMAGDDAALRVHFRPMGYMNGTSDTHHYLTLGPDDSVTMNIKCKEIYISSIAANGYEVFAELTNIPTGSMFELTGSGHSE